MSLLYIWGNWGLEKIYMEKEMATQSSILAWRILWTGEPDALLSMGLHRVGHDWSDLACMCWRRKWQPTPVFLPGESQGQRSLMGCCLWGCTELDTTDLAGAAERIYNSSMDTQITSSCRQDLSPITRTPELDWYTLCYPASLFCFMNNDVNCAEVTDI